MSRNYLNDGWQVVQELSGTTPVANLLTGLGVDEIFRCATAAGPEDFLTDALGSTIGLADEDGVIQTAYTYEPYGASAANGVASGNLYQYTSRENDGGLYYYRNRYYSASLHRFISQDPVGFVAGSNLYAYVRGNPLRFRDPYGLQEEEVEAPSEHFDARTQRACDAAAEANRREQEADERRRNGDWDGYYGKMEDAHNAWARYFRELGQPYPQEAPPRGPTPPTLPPPGPEPVIQPPDINPGTPPG